MLRIKGLKNREVRKGNRLIFQRLESPLSRKRGVYHSFLGQSKVVADFDFSTHTQVEVGIYALHLVEIYPKLRFGEEDDVFLASNIVAITPNISKTIGGHQTASKVVVPSTGELP